MSLLKMTQELPLTISAQLKENRNKTVLFQTNQIVKTTAKCFNCWSQSQSVSAVCPPIPNIDCDWLKQLKHFTALILFCLVLFIYVLPVLFQVYFICAYSISPT